MGSQFKFFKKILNKVRFLFPSRLPIGSTEFDAFCADILNTYGLPDKTSYRHAISTMIMHLGPTQHTVSKKYFAKSILKAMSNEVAYSKIQEYKELQKQEEEQELAASTPEPTPVESDGRAH